MRLALFTELEPLYIVTESRTGVLLGPSLVFSNSVLVPTCAGLHHVVQVLDPLHSQ